MRPLLPVFLLASLVACSPYKKVTLTASERLTKDWKGASEENVNISYGSYKNKTSTPDGYLLLFDYSYASVSPNKSGEDPIRVSHQRSSPMLPPPTNAYNAQGNTGDSVIRRMVFYFDKSRHVQSVEAIGFPDSVYYVKRR